MPILAGWVAAVEGPYDAILTATALHWLSEEDLRRVYGQGYGLLRDGGVLGNGDRCEQRASARSAWCGVA